MHMDPASEIAKIGRWADRSSGTKVRFEDWGGLKMRSFSSLPKTAPSDATWTCKAILHSSLLAMYVLRPRTVFQNLINQAIGCRGKSSSVLPLLVPWLRGDA